MFKKILVIISLFFLSFLTSFADWKEDIESGNYKTFSEVYPEKVNIYEFESVELNDKGEFVIEYTKEHYEKLLDFYGGKNVLGFDKSDNSDFNFEYSINENGNSVFITILKNNIDLWWDFYGNTNFYLGNGDLNAKQFVDGILENPLLSIVPEELYDEFFILLKKGDYFKLEIFFNNKVNNYGDEYSEVKIVDNKLRFYNPNFVVNLYDKKSNFIKQYLDSKYKSYYIKSNIGYIDSINLPFDLIKSYVNDVLYYFVLNYKLVNKSSVLYNFDGDVFLKTSISSIENNKDNFKLDVYFGNNYGKLDCDIISDNKNNIECILDGGIKKTFLFDNIIYVFNNDIYLNFTKILNSFGLPFLYVESIHNFFHNGDLFYSPYLKGKNLFPISSKIKSPKNISTNPALVLVNFILALLYLLTFYFTAQLFNSYFEELSSKNKWNEKISNFLTKNIKGILNNLYNFCLKLSDNKNKPFIRKYSNLVRNFMIKYEHKIYIVFGLLLLGIIGQIVVDDFDILSLKGIFTIIIMIFILAFITLFKDLLLYIFNKGKAKETLKLQNIPVGFIFAGIVAILGRWIGLIPGVMFGSAIRLNAKSNLTSRKTNKPDLLFKVLIIVFLVGILSWLLTILFDSSSFIYKFLIVTYFGLINDVFFALLPFGMLWGVYILKDKKLKTKWFVFTFIIFFFLLHTVLHGEGDLNKILQFDGNFAVLVLILLFWIMITGTLYYINNKKLNSK